MDVKNLGDRIKVLQTIHADLHRNPLAISPAELQKKFPDMNFQMIIGYTREQRDACIRQNLDIIKKEVAKISHPQMKGALSLHYTPIVK